MKALIILVCFQLTLSAKPKFSLQDYWLDSKPKTEKKTEISDNQSEEQSPSSEISATLDKNGAKSDESSFQINNVDSPL